jgi:hypothetical protein
MKIKSCPPIEQSSQIDPEWTVTENPAVRELLDHLAQELANEYLRLMTERIKSPYHLIASSRKAAVRRK